MRILAVGYALPDPEIDNYNPLTAPSYHDYDALIIDPQGITAVVHDLLENASELEAFDGRPVLNAPSTASTVSIADQLQRRRDETERLLEAGGTVVVFGRPNARESGVLGFEGCDRYSWLPAPDGLSWGPPFLRAAEGKTTRIVADNHPMAQLLREFRSEVSYRATFDERRAEVRTNGRVICSGGANVPTGVEFFLHSGRIVFLPAFSDAVGTFRSQLATALVDACRRLTGATPSEEAPYWVRGVALPGLEQAEAELEDLEQKAEAARSSAFAARERHDSIEQYRELLWTDGAHFLRAVADSLRLLGFVVEGGLAGEPITVHAAGVEAFVEAESSREVVVEWPYIRLQRRLEQHLLQANVQLKGIVIANGERLQAPESREQTFTPALRIACENYRYALLPSDVLFALVQRALGGADETELAQVRHRIMRANGLITADLALGEAEEHPQAGPIF